MSTSEHDAPSQQAPAEPLADAAAVAEPVAAEPVVQFYKAVDLDRALSGFRAMEKAGNLYVVRLATPLLVQTPPLVLASPLDDEDGTPLPHAHLSVPKSFDQFLRRTEAAVLDAALEHKDAWFRRPMNDAALRASFKEFCRAGAVRVRVPRDALVFDDTGALVARDQVPAGASVRCLLELSKICFGRTEFGAMWTLLQAQTAQAPPPPPRCMIDLGAEVDDTPEPAGEPPEAHEFL